MPVMGRYPRTGDDLRGIRRFSDDFYFTVLRRFWLVDFVHEGFWPRLICRIANDQQIVQVVYVYLMSHTFVGLFALVCHVHIASGISSSQNHLAVIMEICALSYILKY